MNVIHLEFLTDDENEREACRHYWHVRDDGTFVHSVSQIAQEFGIPRHKVASRITELSHAFFQHDRCATCGTPKLLTSRTDYAQRARYQSPMAWTCQTCRDAKQAEARREADQKVAQIRSEVRQELDHKRRRELSIDRLSFSDAIYLVSLLRIGGSEDLSYIAPLDTFKAPLSPVPDFDQEILDQLYRRAVICVHPGSRPESLVTDGGHFTGFYASKVHWILPLAGEGPSPARFLEELENRLKGGDWLPAWHSESADLHRVVALQECLQYLQVVMKEHGFEAKFGEKTLLVIKSTLTRFSIGQMYNFMWRAARDAAAFYVREGVSKPHAANIVPGSIQRMAERARAEGWSVKPYRRDFRAPLSQLSQVLFTLALRLPDDGMTTIPPSAQDAKSSEESDEEVVTGQGRENEDAG